MNTSTIVFLINDQVRAIKARYESGASPDTFKTMDPNLKVGDLVVVQSSTRHNMTVVEVTEVDVVLDVGTSEQIKWVVQSIDKPAFEKLLKSEAEAINYATDAENRRKREEMRKSIFKGSDDGLNALALTDRATVIDEAEG